MANSSFSYNLTKVICVALGVATTMMFVQYALGLGGILGGILGGGFGVLAGIGLFNFLQRRHTK
ncbi:MAG: hypothetical protein ACK5NT_01555 [Pyrinomonadaceae bacterium]